MMILGIAGSLRKGSYNRMALNAARQLLPDGASLVTFELEGIPPYNQDLEASFPAAATRVKNEIAAADAVLFVTPEYNHGVPAALKNAFDVLAPEWRRKAIAFVSYGADGGVRAVEQWRVITGNMAMLDARAQVGLSLFADFGEAGFAPLDRREGELEALFNEVEALTRASLQLRAA